MTDNHQELKFEKKHLLISLLDIKRRLNEWLDKKEKIIILKDLLNKVTSYREWKKIAIELDLLEGREAWKKKKESSLYDYKELERLIKILKMKRENKDIVGLTHNLRANLVKNLYSTTNPLLYYHTYYGTKYLINNFQEEMLKSLDFIANFDEKIFPFSKKLEFFSEAKHSYGRTALMLSGGASLGSYHIGVIKALFDNDLLPRIVCGSSAGSVIAGILCITPYEQLKDKFKEDHVMHIFRSRIKDLMTYFFVESLYDVSHLKEILREQMGDWTFQEAFDNTGWILNITVTGYKEHDNHRVLNYISSPNVIIWTAACASCAVPGIFDPVELLCKNEYGQIVPYHINKSKYIDGTISSDIPMKRIAELFNVNTFIVSQVNPFVFPFLDNEDGDDLFEVGRKLTLWRFIKYLVGSELKHRCTQLANLGLLPSAFKRYLNLLTQEYRGDVTILPIPSILDLTKTISNLTKDEVDNCKVVSARRTYPKISRIENILKIEKALEKNYTKLKNKIIKRRFSSNKKYGIDEENYDFEIWTRQIVSIERLSESKNQLTTEDDVDSVDEDENLDIISEKHNSIVYYNGKYRNLEDKGNKKDHSKLKIDLVQGNK